MELHLIKLDGKTIGLADAQPQGVGLIQWFHGNAGGQSMDHYLTHEGYSIEFVDELPCNMVTPIIGLICQRAGVTMQAEFVPFSRSRYAGKKETFWLSLNWKITLLRHSRTVIETDYAQGSGHAPAAKAGKMRLIHAGRPIETARHIATQYECENGRIATFFSHSDKPVSGKAIPAPAIGDIMQSLVSDASVLDAGGFEEWAADLGYDSDSRKAESTYKACLETAMRLRSGLGAALLSEIALAAQFN